MEVGQCQPALRRRTMLLWTRYMRAGTTYVDSESSISPMFLGHGSKGVVGESVHFKYFGSNRPDTLQTMGESTLLPMY
jgi:hypothetical protein